MVLMKENFTELGSMLASFMFVWAIFQQYFPYKNYLEKYTHKLVNYFYPYIQIKFNEFTGERLMRSEAHSAIETYLAANSSMQAKHLKAETVKTGQSLALSLDDHEEVSDDYKGVKLWWQSGKNVSKSEGFSFHSTTNEKRYYTLTFHKKYREIVIGPYLNHVLKEGRAIKVQNRQRKLYTNSGSWWSHVVFEHPATFRTLALEAEKKQEIIDDLLTFSNSEDFYTRIGRAWKRGYLLYGPPGTGKSTMIAAMANYLGYDLYDLELTAVRDNTELRKLLVETSSKSIVVIEDIDCSVDLTGQRKKKKKDKEDGEEKESKKKVKEEDNESKNSNVTLSGLLNFIDGLWSACKGERLIVFTTNHVEKLDPALIRRGRMDKHIELSYCKFEAFKVLAKNYLDIDCHDLFSKIEGLLEEVNMTPADVAENLMPKTPKANAGSCLGNLIEALEIVKEEVRVKLEEANKVKNNEEDEEEKKELVMKIDENVEKGNLGIQESDEKNVMEKDGKEKKLESE